MRDRPAAALPGGLDAAVRAICRARIKSVDRGASLHPAVRLAAPPLAVLELGNQRLGCKDRKYKNREYHKFDFWGSFLFPNSRDHSSAGKFHGLNAF